MSISKEIIESVLSEELNKLDNQEIGDRKSGFATPMGGVVIGSQRNLIYRIQQSLTCRTGVDINIPSTAHEEAIRKES